MDYTQESKIQYERMREADEWVQYFWRVDIIPTKKGPVKRPLRAPHSKIWWICDFNFLPMIVNQQMNVYLRKDSCANSYQISDRTQIPFNQIFIHILSKFSKFIIPIDKYSQMKYNNLHNIYRN